MKSTLVHMPAGFTLRALPVVGSTNDVARDHINDANALGPIVIWAEEQTGGKGRSGRLWDSPNGNLYSSILIKDVGPLTIASQLSFLTAISMRAALSKLIPKESVKCKWPNDILVNGSKICGILLECGSDKSANNWVIIGSGVNVSHKPTDAPYSVSHLKQFNEDISTHMVLSLYLKEFSDRLQVWKSTGFNEIREEWIQNCFGLGEKIVARLANKVEEHGHFLDLDADGGLIMEKEDSSKITITAGDVFVKGPLDAFNN